MDWNRSGTSNRSSHKDDFTDLVLSWSLHDIFDENLYKDQVEKIPKSFESVDEYLCSYIFPLLEETRAQLASATETVGNAPSAEVASFTERTHGNLVYNVKVDQWRNVASDNGGEPYKTLPGDVVLLSDSKPETVSDLRRVGSAYTFASVTNIDADDESESSCKPSGFTLKASQNIEFSKSLYVVYLINVTPHKRIWNALRMRRNVTIIQKLLAKNHLVKSHNTLLSRLYSLSSWLPSFGSNHTLVQDEGICEVCCHKNNNEMKEKLGLALFSKLNESQLDAISACLSKSKCDHKSSVELIWGPPGTGKTATLTYCSIPS